MHSVHCFIKVRKTVFYKKDSCCFLQERQHLQRKFWYLYSKFSIYFKLKIGVLNIKINKWFSFIYNGVVQCRSKCEMSNRSIAFNYS